MTSSALNPVSVFAGFSNFANNFKALFESARPSARQPFEIEKTPPHVFPLKYERQALMQRARYLEQNSGITTAVLNSLVNGVISDGLFPTPQIKYISNSLHDRLNEYVIKRWEDFTEHNNIDITGSSSWLELQHSVYRSRCRDGNVFVRKVYPNSLTFKLQIIPCDYLADDNFINKTSGIIRDIWGKPTKYVFDIPVDEYGTKNRVEIDAQHILQLSRRINATDVLGVSILAPIMQQIDDLKQLDTASHEKAKITAMLCLAIHRDVTLSEDDDSRERGAIKLKSGTIVDDLDAGEEVKTIVGGSTMDPYFEGFRADSIRGICTGAGVSATSVSGNFNGSYSSRRQENIETRHNYGIERAAFIEQFHKPIWRTFIKDLQATNAFERFVDVDLTTVFDVDFSGKALPSIDPNKDAGSYKTAIETKMLSVETSRKMMFGNLGVGEKQRIAKEQKAKIIQETLDAH